ncbi:hypothetical protein SAMN05660226_00095 [Parapedobacter luteus]|uniref:Natural product n=1 Tax=Parapedobacter luteus TaxID=623280 RepID=A0A1T4ZUT5_9SPHI|nr:hypothetical protein SAMN05660226_00095 [Parapedobacter luteus]
MNILDLKFGETLTREQMKQVIGGAVKCLDTGGGEYYCNNGLEQCGHQCGEALGSSCGGCFEVIT